MADKKTMDALEIVRKGAQNAEPDQLPEMVQLVSEHRSLHAHGCGWARGPGGGAVVYSPRGAAPN